MRRLEAAGYANVGKTNLHEFAYGVTSQNEHYGTVPNPAAPGRTSGGSSGGTAAAIAAGSRRRRARHRLRRLDPDPGRVLRDRGLQADVRPRADRRRLPARAELRPRRADGARRPRLRRADGGARAGLRGRARRGVGRRRVGGARGAARAGAGRGGGRARSRAVAAARVPGAGRHDARVHARGRGRPPRAVSRSTASCTARTRATKIERCLAVTDAEAEAAGAARQEYGGWRREALEGVDLLLTPTLMFVAPPADIDELAWRERVVRFTYPFNLLGWPALALPCGAGRGRAAGVGSARRAAGRRTRSCWRPGSRSRRRSR